MVRKCGNCGSDVEDDEAVQCPYCNGTFEKRRLPIIGDVLTSIGEFGKMASGVIILCLLLYLFLTWFMSGFSHL